MELENNATAAVKDLVDGLNVSAGAGTYAYIDTGVIGTDAIRVALIYKPGSVTPAGAFMIDNDAIFDRPPLAQTFQVVTTGETFSVVVNHFKSKSCGSAAGLDANQGDGQGCYNDRRKQQAAQLLSFINTTIIPASGDGDVLIIGDLNSYAKEDPITVLSNGGFANLKADPAAYSYSFSGQSGYLDHALANASLAAQVTGITDWHINADEPPDFDYNDDVADAGESNAGAEYNQPGLYAVNPFRTSDHDPVMVGLDLMQNDWSDLAAPYGAAWHTPSALSWARPGQPGMRRWAPAATMVWVVSRRRPGAPPAAAGRRHR